MHDSTLSSLLAVSVDNTDSTKQQTSLATTTQQQFTALGRELLSIFAVYVLGAKAPAVDLLLRLALDFRRVS